MPEALSDVGGEQATAAESDEAADFPLIDGAANAAGAIGGASDLRATAARDPLDRLIEQGKERLEAGDLTNARQSFSAALERDPKASEALLWLCRLAYREFNWSDLRSITATYLEERPENREVVLLHARACSGLSDWTAAAKAWRDVGEDRPGWAEAMYQRGRAEVQLGDDRAAMRSAEELLAMEAGGPMAQCYAGRLLIELNELARARPVFTALFRSSPEIAQRELQMIEAMNDPRALAIVLSARQEVEGVGEAYDERVIGAGEALFGNAIRHERAGHLIAALLDYEALLALTPEDNLAQRSRARIVRELRRRAQELLLSDNTDEAIEAFALAVRAAPADLALRRSCGRVLMKARRWREASRLWRALAEDLPGDSESAVQLARSLDRSGQYRGAIAAWRTVAQRDPENEEARASLSTIVRRMTVAGREAIAAERFVDAYEIFRTVVEEEAGNEEGLRRIEQIGRNVLKAMRAAFKARDLRAVLRYSHLAGELLPEDADAQLLIARSAEAMRRHEVALAAWSKLSEHDPSQTTLAELHIARCHLHLGRAEEGQRMISKVLARDPKNAEALDLSARLGSLT